MCLIIWNPKGHKLRQDNLEAANWHNSDGFGVMYLEKGRIRAEHSIGGFDQIKKVTDRLHGRPHAIHFRFRTRGESGLAQCHPFEVLNKEKHGMDLWMMHNGTFSDVRDSNVESDTQIFAGMLRERFLESPRDTDFSQTLKSFNKIIGRNNKLMFMSSDLDAVLVNQSRGTWISGSWYSNTYSLQRPKYVAPRKTATSAFDWVTRPTNYTTKKSRSFSMTTGEEFTDDYEDGLPSGRCLLPSSTTRKLSPALPIEPAKLVPIAPLKRQIVNYTRLSGGKVRVYTQAREGNRS